MMNLEKIKSKLRNNLSKIEYMFIKEKKGSHKIKKPLKF